MPRTASHERLKIGSKLRHARKLRDLSLTAVAQKVGCSEGYVSKIENNKAAPSLSMLHRIAAVLGINLSYLFDGNEEDQAVIAREGSRPVIELDSLRQGQGIRLERIIPYSVRHLLQCNIHIVEPGGTSDGQIQHQGEEVGYILEGQIELTVGDRAYTLRRGDTFHFPSDSAHGYRNLGTTTARIFWVNTPPTF